MKTKLALSSLILISLPLASCASPFPDIKVDSETNPKVELSSYKTYSWAAAAAVIRDAAGTWEAPDLNIGSEIMYLSNRELRKKGMTEVVDSPDLAAIYAVGVDMEALDVVVDEDSREKTTEAAPKGGVLIILVDPGTRRVVWSGRATADISENPSQELAKKRLDYAITEIFKQFDK
ncbi:MAG: DUF4136 domain-containing protein [Planctomycetota bacterium]|jgi:hypothetical protein